MQNFTGAIWFTSKKARGEFFVRRKSKSPPRARCRGSKASARTSYAASKIHSFGLPSQTDFGLAVFPAWRERSWFPRQASPPPPPASGFSTTYFNAKVPRRKDARGKTFSIFFASLRLCVEFHLPPKLNLAARLGLCWGARPFTWRRSRGSISCRRKTTRKRRINFRKTFRVVRCISRLDFCPHL